MRFTHDKEGQRLLNAPTFSGYGVLIETEDDEVLIVAPSAAIAEGLAAYLSSGPVKKATKLRIGEPWEPPAPRARQRSFLDELP